MGIWNKIKNIKDKAKIAIAVGRVVAGGKAPRTFDKIEQGADIAEKAFEIADMVAQMLRKKPK